MPKKSVWGTAEEQKTHIPLSWICVITDTFDRWWKTRTSHQIRYLVIIILQVYWRDKRKTTKVFRKHIFLLSFSKPLRWEIELLWIYTFLHPLDDSVLQLGPKLHHRIPHGLLWWKSLWWKSPAVTHSETNTCTDCLNNKTYNTEHKYIEFALFKEDPITHRPPHSACILMQGLQECWRSAQGWIAVDLRFSAERSLTWLTLISASYCIFVCTLEDLTILKRILQKYAYRNMLKTSYGVVS